MERSPLLVTALSSIACLAACADASKAAPPGAVRWEYRQVRVAEIVDVPTPDDLSMEQFFAQLALEKSDEELARIRAAEGGADFLERVDEAREQRKALEEAYLDGLNELGAAGWEVVTVQEGLILLKRRRT